ncbi:50S ribosome-binding GTPase [candidate division TA06 bacterium]|uniref:50S ribosome-binding GTPase n=1 Tax=candidate division TA06 bacterium TaxID=2250710 RepID=A0A933ICZ5_UNCT6|nr:50S ribosome-binding GTPase [candidate division TA06 bacterium]
MLLSLLEIKNGESGRIENIFGGPGLQARLERLGLHAGLKITKVSDFGPVVVSSDNGQAAIGRGMAGHIKVMVDDFKVLLFGNPNVGKSVVFSRLTGLGAVSSNYAGTTVEFSKGAIWAEGKRMELIDVPGAYTLEATCAAEKVASDFCSRDQADLIVNVVDANNLERNLYLTLQLLEKKIPMMVVLNKWDIARRKGININCDELAKRLGVKVIPVVAVTGQGLRELMSAVAAAGREAITPPVFKPIDHQERWHIIGHISQEVQRITHKHPSPLEKLEDASVRPLSGVPIALAVMVFSFTVIRFLGEGLIKYLMDPFFKNVYGPVVHKLVSFIPWPVLRHLLAGRTPEFMESFGALTTGVYIPMAIVLPYIITFYLVLGFLEDIGYLPRLAVLLDRTMHRLGLHGYAALPLVLSCGCKVPGVLALRVLESRREKILALTLLLMAAPCLPQSAMIVSLLSNFGMGYVLMVFGILILVAVINSLFLNRILKGQSPEIIMEIPSYQIPHAGTLFRKTWLRVKSFLQEATPLIALGVLAVNILEMLGVIRLLGRLARPLVVNVLGLPSEAISVILFGFLRKDISIALLEPLNLSPKQAVIASVFLVLYLPCLATFFVAFREIGWKGIVRVLALTFSWAVAVGFLINMLWI